MNLYIDVGFYKESLISITKKGIEGANEIKQMMIDLRENPMKEINGQRVICIEDYQASKGKDFMNNEEFEIHIPKSNVLIYYLEDGSKICARPSGTEPKINGQRVVCIEDYQSSKGKDIINDEEFELNIPKSNVLIYYLEDGSKICARPSGTEPKIKFYFSVNGVLDTIENAESVEKELDNKIAGIISAMKLN